MSSLHLNPDTISEVPSALSCALRWSATHSRWSDSDIESCARVPAHQSLSLVVALHVLDDCASIEAWTESRCNERHVVQHRRIAPCSLRRSDGLVHIDVVDADQSLLKLTATAQGKLVYARSALLCSDAFGAGYFDPPVLTVENGTVS